MEVNFLDTACKSILLIKSKDVDFDLTDLNQLRIEKDNFLIKKEVEQLNNKVLNSLNYASSQKILPSTLPEQLNVKFLNTSTLDKIIDRIIPSPIAQLEAPNTMYISTNLLPQN